MDVEVVCRRLDRFAGGRHAGHRIPEAARTDPAVRRTFTGVAAVLVAVFVVGAAAVAQAVHLSLTRRPVSPVVWWRLVVVFMIACTLFYFWWRARRGWWWAFSRLRLFSMVFPVIAVSTCLIPGLYPGWMIEEQLAVSGCLLVMSWLLSRPPLRQAYTRPGAAGNLG